MVAERESIRGGRGWGQSLPDRIQLSYEKGEGGRDNDTIDKDGMLVKNFRQDKNYGSVQ